MAEKKEIIYDRVEAYRAILDSEQHGNVSDLNISRELFRNFCLVGYIQQGVDGAWEKRWKLTDFGRTQMQAHLVLMDFKEQLEAQKRFAREKKQEVVAL